MGTQGQITNFRMPHGDPNAPGGSGTVGGDLLGGFFGMINPYVGMFAPPPHFMPLHPVVLQVKPKAIVMMMRSRICGRPPLGPLCVMDDKGEKRE